MNDFDKMSVLFRELYIDFEVEEPAPEPGNKELDRPTAKAISISSHWGGTPGYYLGVYFYFDDHDKFIDFEVTE